MFIKISAQLKFVLGTFEFASHVLRLLTYGFFPYKIYLFNQTENILLLICINCSRV